MDYYLYFKKNNPKLSKNRGLSEFSKQLHTELRDLFDQTDITSEDEWPLWYVKETITKFIKLLDTNSTDYRFWPKLLNNMPEPNGNKNAQDQYNEKQIGQIFESNYNYPMDDETYIHTVKYLEDMQKELPFMTPFDIYSSGFMDGKLIEQNKK